MKQTTYAFPLAIAFGLGFGLLIAGAALGNAHAVDWLSFAGSLIGSAIAALTGFWLIVVQEARISERKTQMVGRSLDLISNPLHLLKGVGRGVPSVFFAETLLEDIRVNVEAVRIVAHNFGTENVETMAAINNLITLLDNTEWKIYSQLARSTDTSRRLYPRDQKNPRDAGDFDALHDSIGTAVERVRRTL